MTTFGNLNELSNLVNDREDPEDILNESLAFFGGEPTINDDAVRYGPLVLTVAPKEGKALSLLADHLFSPALFLAERIELDLIPAKGRRVIELGAGSALPSLLLATRPDPPSLLVVTDYPDDAILGNLQKNVENNRTRYQTTCCVKCVGFEWGTTTDPLLKLSNSENQSCPGYDIVLLSDLLHFDASHDVLLASVGGLLAKSPISRMHISAGYYTRTEVCDSFLFKCREAGFSVDEIFPSVGDNKWLGKMTVGGLDADALATRKAACRYWIGRWATC